jgi:hypothetical protein
MTRVHTITRILATAAALGMGMAALSAAAQDTVVRPTTGSHIDPNARAQMLETIVVPGGAIDAARAVPIDAREAQALARPQIDEIDAAQWLPTSPAETNQSK